MDVVCEVCGAVGYRHLLVQCNSCKNATRHRYCMTRVIYDGSSIEWLCDDCDPKFNKVAESLKWRCENHHSIQLGSSIVDEPNVNRVEVTKASWSWGRRRHRSHKARRHYTWGHRRNRSRVARGNNTDACTHFPSGATFNSCEMLFGENSKCNDVGKEGESKNEHLTYWPTDGSNHSASDLVEEIQKTMGDVEATIKTMECLNLSKKKDSCSLSLDYVEGSIPRGSKADFSPSIRDVERSHPFATDNSCPTPPIVMQKDGSNLEAESAEQFHPLETVNPDGSSHSPSDPGLEAEEQGVDAGLFASVNDVEQSHPSSTDDSSPTLSSEKHVGGSSPTSECWEQPEPLEVIKPWDDASTSILGSKPPSNYSQPMQASDQDVRNMNVLDPSKECLGSRSVSKTVDSSSFSNGGGSTVDKDHVDRTECLSGMEAVAPALNNVQGSSPLTEPSNSPKGGDSTVEINGAKGTECLSGTETVGPALDNVQGASASTAKECLVSDVDNSDEANRSGKNFLCTTENKEGGQSEVLPHPNILNGRSGPNSGLGGRNTQNDLPKASVSAGKNVVCIPVSQIKDVDSEVLPSKNVSSCKATKGSFKKQPNSHAQSPIKHQKTKVITKDRNADPAWPKSSRPSQQLDRASLELPSKNKEVHGADDSEPRCSSFAQTFENVVPMKRRRLILPYYKDAEAMHVEDLNPPCSEDDGEVRMNMRQVPMKRRRLILPYNEDAEAMQVEDLNPPCSENDREVRMNMRQVESGVMNRRRTAENHNEVLCPGNSNNQHVNMHPQTKQQRRPKKDKKAPLGNPSVCSAPNDVEQLAQEAAVLAEGSCSLTKMPSFSVSTDNQHSFCPQPVDKSFWTGLMKIDKDYIFLAAHLSNQACEKVQELSLSLPPVMKVTKHWKLKAWPCRWEASELTAESISLYFFSDNMRPNKELDQLVQHVTDQGIVLKYVFGLSKLLIFPSVILPEQCQTLQGKHYLWGVFRSRSGKKSKAASQVKQKASTSHDAEKNDHQDKVQGDTQIQETPVSKVQGDTWYQEIPISMDTMPDVGTEVDPSDHTKPTNLEASQVKQKASTLHAAEKKDHQDKVQGDTQDQEPPVSKVQGDTQNQEMPVPKGTMPSESQPSPGDIHDVGTEVDPSDHMKPANSEALPTKLIVVAQTPRSERFIKELENEGALVFAVKGLMKPGLVRLSTSSPIGSDLTRNNDAPASAQS